MAFINGPNIVMDNLIVCYDAQNPQSWVSNVVVDNVAGSQFQGSAYTSFNVPSPTPYPKYLSFDGANDVLYSGTSFPATTGFSLSFWVKHTGVQSGNFNRLFGTVGNRFEIAEGTDDTIRIYEGAWQTSTVTIGSSATFDNIVVVNTVDPLLKIYKNGSLAQTISAGRSMTNVGWRLGGNSNTTPTEMWKGQLAHFMAHTKELTTSEVQQNFNALKNRFI